MAGSTWTAWFKIKDINAQATLGSLSDGANKLSETFSGKLMKSLNTFNLMKEAIMAVVKGAQELVNESKEIVTMSTRFDIPIEKLGGLRNAARSLGMDANGLGGALQALEKSINNSITRPGMDASRTLTKLGISQGEVNGMSSRTDIAFQRVLASLRGIKDEGERAAATQEIFGGAADTVTELLKRNQEQIQAASDAAYEYSDSLTKNNSETLDALNDINENMKPIYQFVAALGGFIVQILATIVQGVKVVAKLILDVVLGLVEAIQGAVQTAVYGVIAGAQLMYYGAKKGLGLMTDTAYEEKKKLIELDTGAKVGGHLKTMQHGIDRMTTGVSDKDMATMNNRLTKLGASAYAMGESLGGESMTEKYKNEISDIDEEIVKLREMYNERKKLAKEQWDKNDMKGFLESKKSELELEEKIIAKQQKKGELQKELATLGLKKPAEGSQKQDSNVVEDMREMDRLKKQELALEKERIMLEGAPQIAKDMLEARVAVEKQITAEKELAKIQLGRMSNKEREAKYAELQKQGYGFTDEEKQKIAMGGTTTKRDEARERELQNKAAEAANARLRAEHKVNQWSVEQSKVITDAERDRRLQAIDAVHEREKYVNKQKGVNAIKQQENELNFQIESIKREEEKLAVMEKNPMATTAEKEAQRGVIQKKVFGAAGEMDKLMAMQYNFVASNAAKAGMGGGVSMANNLIDINKEQLNYLKKLYEAVLNANGMSGKPFMYDPLTLQGRNVRD